LPGRGSKSVGVFPSKGVVGRVWGKLHYRPCGLGTWDDKNNTEDFTCWDCPPGKYNNIVDQSLCYPCRPGSYSNRTGAAACDYCPRQTAAPIYGALNCTECPAGSVAGTEGSRECKACSGFEFAHNARCLLCPKNAECALGLINAKKNYFLLEERDVLGSVDCGPQSCKRGVL
jgi:hypothetical protein